MGKPTNISEDSRIVLTPGIVRQMRTLRWAKGWKLKEIVERFEDQAPNLNESNVFFITTGHTWKHVPFSASALPPKGLPNGCTMEAPKPAKGKGKATKGKSKPATKALAIAA